MLSNIHKAINLQEEYNLLKNSESTLQFNETAFNFWKNNYNVLSEKSFQDLITSYNYDENILSNAMSYNSSKEEIKLYNNYVRNKEWYNFFYESFQNLNLYKYECQNDLLIICKPFLNKVYTELLNYFELLQCFKNQKELINILMTHLEDTLFEIIHRVMILDINEKKNKKILKGSNSEERYDDYISLYYSNDVKLNLFSTYPTLLRDISVKSMFMLNYSKELLFNIKNDHKEIEKFFDVNLGNLKSVDIGKGDTHNQGRTVCLLEYEHKTLIYKPKKLDVNVSIYKFSEKINAISTKGSIKVPKTKVFSTHSYEELIEYEPCSNNRELKDYYYNYGFLMGIIYYLNGNDIHYENLISNNVHPVVVDYETLLQQPINFENVESKNNQLIEKNFFRISKTALLPNTSMNIKTNETSIDISALSGQFQEKAVSGYKISNIRTDNMRYEEVKLDFSGSQNIPTEDVNSRSYMKYKDEIKLGFSESANLIRKLANNYEENFSMFKNIQLRVIFRNTSNYDSILYHIKHPDLQKNMLDRDKILYNLWALPLANKEIIKSEKKQMYDLDIPIFFMNSSENIVMTPHNKKIEGLINKTPYDFLYYSLKKLDEENIEEQKELIDIHFPTFFYEKKKEFENRHEQKYSNITLINEAKEIGNKIAYSSIKYQNTYQWFIPENTEEDKWITMMMDNNIYNGKSGIFLFFYFLNQQTGLYKEFLDSMILELKENRNDAIKNLGLNSSELGYFYAFSLIDDYLDYEDIVIEHIYSIMNTIDINNVYINLDYINGALPFLNTLIRYFEKFNDNVFLEMAKKIIELIEINDFKDTDGFGHGNSGIKYTINNINRYIYSEKLNNILEQLEQKHINLVTNKSTWCNGNLGEFILNENNNIEEISMLDNDCLCHGNMGIVDIYLTRGHLNDSKELLNNIIMEKQFYGEYKIFDTYHWRDTSLFSGIAGIGYQILRTLDNNMKSLLTI